MQGRIYLRKSNTHHPLIHPPCYPATSPKKKFSTSPDYSNPRVLRKCCKRGSRSCVEPITFSPCACASIYVDEQIFSGSILIVFTVRSKRKIGEDRCKLFHDHLFSALSFFLSGWLMSFWLFFSLIFSLQPSFIFSTGMFFSLSEC